MEAAPSVGDQLVPGRLTQNGTEPLNGRAGSGSGILVADVLVPSRGMARFATNRPWGRSTEMLGLVADPPSLEPLVVPCLTEKAVQSPGNENLV
jgi:hypothetical protein